MVVGMVYRGMVKLSLMGLAPYQSYALIKASLSPDRENPYRRGDGKKITYPFFKSCQINPIQVLLRMDEGHSNTQKPCNGVHLSNKAGSIPSLTEGYFYLSEWVLLQ